MNILLIIPENTGTIASISHDLYNGLCQQANTKVYVACLGEYSLNGFQFQNVFIIKGHNTNIFSKLYHRIYKLRKIKKELHINLTISTLLGATYWNVLSGIGESKIGVFHTKLSQRKSAGYSTYFISYIVTKVLCMYLSKLIAVNKSAYDDLTNLFKRKKEIELVYNIHNFNRITLLSKQPLPNDSEIQLFSRPVILFVGGLYHNVKGTDRLIKAFAKIKANSPEFILVFIGEDLDNSLPLLKKIVVEYSMQDAIFFLGKKSNPYTYMKSAQMLVSPSRDEGLPGVLIEALSLGVKCVATNSSEGVWEIMQCDNEYNPNLMAIKRTQFGFITPNIIDDEEFTVKCMAEAMKECLHTKFDIKGNFNTSRFSAEQIIPHYINVKGV